MPLLSGDLTKWPALPRNMTVRQRFVLDGVDVELAHLPDPQGHLIQDDDGNVLAAGRGAEGARLVTMSVWGVR